MFVKKYRSIMEKPEDHRNRWAVGLAVVSSLFIFAGFGFYKGYISIEINRSVAPKTQVATPIMAEDAPSPIDNSKKIFKSAFIEIESQYRAFKESVSSVIVPFITGIEVYERE